MYKYLFFMFFISINVYADNYILEYNSNFTTCDGIERIVANNDPKYVTDITIPGDHHNTFKRVMFAYKDYNSALNIVSNESLEYFALILKTKKKTSLDKNENPEVGLEIDWENSLLANIDLNKVINITHNNTYHIIKCDPNYYYKVNHSIRDKIVVKKTLRTYEYRMDSFMAITNNALKTDNSHIFNIEQPLIQLKNLWVLINNHRKYLIENEYLRFNLHNNDLTENFIIHMFNTTKYSYNYKTLINGLSYNDCAENNYIVKTRLDYKEFYLCGLNLNNTPSMFDSLFSNKEDFKCFLVTLKSDRNIANLNDVNFQLLDIGVLGYTDDEPYFYLNKNPNIYIAKVIDNNKISLTNKNPAINGSIILDQRVIYFLKLGFLQSINNGGIVVNNSLNSMKTSLSQYKERFIDKAASFEPRKKIDHNDDEFYPL